MTRDLKLYLDDMFDALEEVEEFLKSLSFDDFCKDTKTIRAVTMDFIIIGEAAKHVPTEVRKRHPQIPWSKVIGMRNILTMTILKRMLKYYGKRQRNACRFLR
jgi:uncharacterized protein with HEPN domain